MNNPAIFLFPAVRKFLCIAFLFSLVYSTSAQTTLTYGDICFIGLNAQVPPGHQGGVLQWVPLVDLAPGTVIKFTNTGWHNNSSTGTTGNARSGNNAITVWTNTTGSTIAAGTLIIMENVSYTASLGTLSYVPTSCGCGSTGNGYMGLLTTMGHVFVYYGGTTSSTSTDFGSSALTSTFNGTPITMMGYQGIDTNGTWLTHDTATSRLTYLPSDLNSFSIFLNNHANAGYYTGPRHNGTRAAYMAALLNTANWTTLDSGGIVVLPTDNLTFGTGGVANAGNVVFSVYQNSTANNISANLAIMDTTMGRGDTITVTSGPSHGSLGGFPFIGVSSGAFNTPMGLSYTPTSGYAGTDAFTVMVKNGHDSYMATYTITVKPALAPTALTYGDVCITGWNTSTTPASYQWVALKPLTPGTTVKFSAIAFYSSVASGDTNNVRGGTGISAWTNTTSATIPAGTVITNDQDGNTSIGTMSYLPSTCYCGGHDIAMGSSNSGGSIFVYYGGINNTPATDFAGSASPTTFHGTAIELFAYQGNGAAQAGYTHFLTSGIANRQTYLPSDLNSYSLFLAAAAVAGNYTGPRTGGTIASYRAAILNPSNWTTVGTGTVSFNNTNFTFPTPGHAPFFVSGTTQALTFCDNAGSRNLNNMLKVNDADTGDAIVMSLLYPPHHGTATTSYTTTSTGGVLIPSGVSYIPTGGFDGRDTFTVQVTDGTYTATTTIYVTVNPSPVTPTISGATFVCMGGITTLTATPTGGYWGSMDANTTTIPTTGIVTGRSGSSSMIYYVGPYNAFSCRTQATYTIAVTNLPSAGTLSGATSVCPGASFTLASTVSGGSWSTYDPGIATVNMGGVVTGVHYGTTNITYTVTNACRSSSTLIPVTILGTPVLPGAIGGVPNICEGGGMVTYTNPLAGGVWSISNPSLATISTTGTVTGITAGLDTVLYSFTNVCGIVRTEPKYITVRPLPNPGSISGISTIIRGSNAVLTESVSGGVWSSSNLSLATVSSGGRFYAVNPGTDTVIYAVTNGCGTTYANRVISITAHRMDENITGAAESNISLSIYPNPTNGLIVIELNGAEGITSATVSDVVGKVILAGTSNITRLSLDLSNLPIGTYIVKVSNNGYVYSEKIVVE